MDFNKHGILRLLKREETNMNLPPQQE
jgi:hypothetical protein